MCLFQCTVILRTKSDCKLESDFSKLGTVDFHVSLYIQGHKDTPLTSIAQIHNYTPHSSIIVCHCNCFLLGSWSLLQVIDLLDYKSAVMAVRAHLLGLLITYVRVNPPGLSKRPEDYWRGETVDQDAWDKCLQQLIDKDYEAHVHKVYLYLHGWFNIHNVVLSHNRKAEWLMAQLMKLCQQHLSCLRKCFCFSS